MIPYWFIFSIAAWRSLVKPRSKFRNYEAVLIWLTLVIFIGLRHEVGGDWANYQIVQERITLGEITLSNTKEPLFTLVNLISMGMGFGIYGVNFISAIIFTTALVYFCQNTPRPWLALTTSIPYLVIVVAMGYTRQSVAIGLIMIGLVLLSKGKLLLFTIYSFLAMLFQQTSILILTMLFPYVTRSRKAIGRLIKIILCIFVAFIIYSYSGKLLGDYSSLYLTKSVGASGVYIRLSLVTIPGAIFLIYGKRLDLSRDGYTLWKSVSIYSLACFAALFIIPSTAAIDRLALYALPILLFVSSILPDLNIIKTNVKILTYSVVIFAFLVQFVWLNFGTHAWGWIPYNNVITNIETDFNPNFFYNEEEFSD